MAVLCAAAASKKWQGGTVRARWVIVSLAELRQSMNWACLDFMVRICATRSAVSAAVSMQKFFSKAGLPIGVPRTMIPSGDGVNC